MAVNRSAYSPHARLWNTRIAYTVFAMQSWNLTQEAVKAVFSLLSALVVLALGWLIGNKLTYRWNVRQKKREFQLNAAQQFYVAYGEFFAVWKLWNRLDHDANGYEDRRWELHKRSAAAEAIIEGTLVKLCSELTLTSDDIRYLARFRQAFQELRQSIRVDRHLLWPNSENPAYVAFKSLALRISALLTSEWPSTPPSRELAIDQLLNISSNSWEGKWVD